MTVTKRELDELLSRAQHDFRDGMAKLMEARRMVATLDLPTPRDLMCEHCDGLRFTSQPKLAEHLYLHHDGPEPAHWVEAERLAAE